MMLFYVLPCPMYDIVKLGSIMGTELLKVNKEPYHNIINKYNTVPQDHTWIDYHIVTVTKYSTIKPIISRYSTKPPYHSQAQYHIIPGYRTIPYLGTVPFHHTTSAYIPPYYREIQRNYTLRRKVSTRVMFWTLQQINILPSVV